MSNSHTLLNSFTPVSETTDEQTKVLQVIVAALPEHVISQSYIVCEPDCIIINDISTVDNLLHEIIISRTEVVCYVRRNGKESEYTSSIEAVNADVVAALYQ